VSYIENEIINEASNEDVVNADTEKINQEMFISSIFDHWYLP